MQPDSNASVIDRIIAWFRGLFGAGKSVTDSATRDVRRTAHEATDTVRDGVGDAGQTFRDGVGDGGRKIRDIADRRGGSSTTSTDRGRDDLPDLPDEAAGGGRSTFNSASFDRDAAATFSTGAAFSRESSDEAVDLRSDFDDAAGDLVTGDENFPPAGADLDSATNVHDAVGGRDERADDTIDGTIDTTRDADLRPAGAESLQDREIPLQDQLIVDEGASSDEFDGDEITAGNTDNPYVTTEDVASAAEGYGDTDDTGLANTSPEGTSSLTGSTYTETDVVVPPAARGVADQQQERIQDTIDAPDDDGGFNVVERYNYGVGDLGVGAGTTPDTAWDHDAGPDVSTADIDSGVDADINASRHGDDFDGASADTLDRAADGTAAGGIDASVSPDATRTEIESQSRGDAVNRSVDATQTPGFGDAETFDSAAAGTTEPSRSSTGDDMDSGQDALGTTLDYSEESDAFDEEAANLSGEDELGVSDENVDFGAERVATFQSGTIAQDGGLASGGVTNDEEVTDEAYADLPDEPAHATADDAGVDDLAGSDYPSDHIVDTLDGDDFTDAEVPDVPDLDSSAGDLGFVSTDASEQVDYVTEPVGRTIGDAGERIDQDELADTDQTVGEDVSELESSASLDVEEAGAQSLTGTGTTGAADTAYGATVGESAPASGSLPGESDAADLTVASGAAMSGQVSDSASERRSGAGDASSAPAGSVPGDGGTEAPAGYPVKGNADSMIYHLPHYPSYRQTKAEYYFATEEDAVAAGYRAPGNVRHGHAAGGAAASAAAAVADDTGAVTGDETSHAAPGEIAFDDRLSDDQGVSSDTPAGSLTATDTSNESSTTGEATGIVSEEISQDADVSADSASDAPAGSIPGDGGTEAPAGYPVKGNADSMIYHLPHFPSYRQTKAEYYFATEEDAVAAGYRAPGNVRHGHAAGGAAASAAAAVTDESSSATGTAGRAETGDSDAAGVSSDVTDTGLIADGAGSSSIGGDEAAADQADSSGTAAGAESDQADVPAGAVAGDGGAEAPAGYPIKGNADSMIYHLPEFSSYRRTKAEYWFATEQDAINAGYRAPANAHRGGHAAGGAASSAAGAAHATEEIDTGGGADVDDATGSADATHDSEFDMSSSAAGDATEVDASESVDAAGSEATTSDANVPAGAVRSDGGTEAPAGYPVKGNANSMIYHLPSFPSYKSTKAEYYFASEEDAISAGYRAPGKRNRGKKH